jgi:hypothetical protein
MSLAPHDSHLKSELTRLISDEHRLMDALNFTPFGGETSYSPFLDSETTEMPKTLEDLTESISRSYDLSVTSALESQVPVAGSGNGSFNRRVIVLERCGFKRIPGPEKEAQFGYAIRLCVTVNNWQSTIKVSLPFLAASAQLGTIEAQWTLDVRGLVGPLLTQLPPPTDLNVETFVLAKQSMEKIASAINSPETKFRPLLIAEIRNPDPQSSTLRQSVGRAFALSSLDHGRSLEDTLKKLGPCDQATFDAIVDVYKNLAGLVSQTDTPSNDVRQKARELCGRIRADIPWLG